MVFDDTHGKLTMLRRLLAELQPTAADELIFLGDYIDRGTDGWGVLKEVYGLAQRLPRVVCLQGNHEQMLLNRLDGHASLASLLQADPMPFYKGDNSIAQLQAAAEKEPALLAEILRWLQALPSHYERNGIHFSHAGCNPDLPLEQQTPTDFVWPREEFYEGYRGDALWLIGHTPVQNVRGKDEEPLPLFLENNVILLDTGAFLQGGRLSCMELVNGEIYQVENKN